MRIWNHRGVAVPYPRHHMRLAQVLVVPEEPRPSKAVEEFEAWWPSWREAMSDERPVSFDPEQRVMRAVVQG